MKRQIILLLSFLGIITAATAVPARQRPISIMQPDGTSVTICLHGDEYRHYYTTSDGYSVIKNPQGFYVYAVKGSEGKLEPTDMVAHDGHGRSLLENNFLGGMQKHIKPATSEMKQANESLLKIRAPKAMKRKAPAQSTAMAGETAGASYTGEYGKVPVILIEFTDKAFSLDDYHAVAKGMFDTENYNGYTGKDGRKVACTGSVRDYFTDSSGGAYTPSFDVYGPYKVNYSQYAPKGTDNARQILLAAVTMADADINFKDYDGDGDGMVDAIYFLVAGNGANFSGNDERLFWPHQSWLVNWRFGSSYTYIYKDGVALGQYASGVELYGFTMEPSTVDIDGIGTVCHEFSHVLGLPDFYDTDYEGSGGESITPGDWSIMAGGSYLNNGRTPIGYSLFERFMLGFATPRTISEAGSYELQSLAKSNSGCRLMTANGEKEYFMIENRQMDDKWDQYAPGHGMLVFRVDFTSDKPWDDWDINIDPAHNYYELLRAGGYMGEDSASDPFPGTGGVTQLSSSTSPASLRSWDGKDCPWKMESIMESNGNISFTVVAGNGDDTIPVTGIALDHTATTMTVGSTLQLVATVWPENATDKSLDWESDNSDVASVSSDGQVTALSAGNAVVTCSAKDDSGVYASCVVTVTEATSIPAPYFIAIDCDKEKPVKLTTGDVLKLTAILGNNGGAGMVKTMPIVIAKDADMNMGDLQIDKNGNLRQTVLAKAKVDIVHTGETASKRFEAAKTTFVEHTLPMQPIPEGHYYATVLLYKESDDASENGWHCDIGQLLPIAVGEDSVMAANVELDQKAATLHVGDSIRLSVKAWPQSMTEKDIRWTTSNQDIVTVDDTGLVKAIGEGEAMIICKATGSSANADTCTVTVLSNGISTLQGDVNGDNAVNGTDLVVLVNIILNKGGKDAAADVNGDGAVNGTDYVVLVNIVMGRKD